MHGNVGGPPGIVAQQRHHLRRFARPVDAAIQPDIGVERTRMRQPRHAAIRQVEGGAAQVEHRVVLAAQHLERARRDRTFAVHQRRGEPADAVAVGGGLAEDLVVLGKQAQRGAGARQHVGIAAHLHGQPVGAAPDGRREVGAQDHLHAGRGIRRAVAGAGDQRIETRAGRGQRVGHRQRGVRAAVGLPFRDVGAALPDDASALFADPVGIPGIDRLTQLRVAHEADNVALGQPRERQLDGGEIDRAQADRRRLAARQQEHARVEVDARAAIGHGDGEAGVLDQAETGLARHPGAQHDPRGGARGQAGDADLVALAGDRRTLAPAGRAGPSPRHGNRRGGRARR